MASANTIPISSTVRDLWVAERNSGSARWLRLAIQNEVCTLLGQHAAAGSTESDFAALAAEVSPSAPCYVLFREEGRRWVLVSYIPDGASVRERTMYASALNSLARDLGDEYFGYRARFATPADFSWSALKAEQQPVECLNEREQHFKQLDEMENTARREMEEAAIEKMKEKRAAKQAGTAAAAPKTARPMPTPPAAKKTTRTPAAAATAAAPASPAGAKKGPSPAASPAGARKAPATAVGGTPKTAAAASPAAARAVRAAPAAGCGSGGSSVAAMKRAFENPEELSTVQRPAASSVSPSVASEFGNADALGGYHTVVLPFSPECQDAFEKLKQGALSTMAMRIEHETVVLAKTGSGVATSALAQYLDPEEPRFLLHRVQGTAPAAATAAASATPVGAKTLFVYCCPDKSKPKLRMVYSTSKPSIVDEAERHGIAVSGKMEVRSGSELTAAAVNEAVRPRQSGAGYGYVRNAQTANAAAKSAVRTPHPVYSQIAQNRTTPGPMKRIVLPPSAAYN